MYYPYFRGRQSELLALRDTVSKLAVKKRVVPIIEPVMANTGGLKTFLESAKAQHPHVVITNPAVGELVGQTATIEALTAPYLATPGNQLLPGFHVGPTTTAAQVAGFLAKYRTRETVMVFDRPMLAAIQGAIPGILAAPVKPVAVFVEGKVSPSLIQSLMALDKVLLRDGFITQTRNADYPRLDFFSDLHRTYAAAGYHGFGDFSVIGEGFNPGGGPAHAVAIHLTELNANHEIDTNHFVSTRTTGTVDTAGKFMEALDKLVVHVRAHRRAFTYSQARAEFEGHHTSQHFPGLPTVKRLSIRHHLELLESIV
jgi:hypothetical protein